MRTFFIAAMSVVLVGVGFFAGREFRTQDDRYQLTLQGINLLRLDKITGETVVYDKGQDGWRKIMPIDGHVVFDVPQPTEAEISNWPFVVSMRKSYLDAEEKAFTQTYLEIDAREKKAAALEAAFNTIAAPADQIMVDEVLVTKPDGK